MENGGSHEDFVRVEIDKPRVLRFDTNSICDFEEKAGQSIVDVVFGQKTLTLSDIRLLLWAGLKHEEPRLTKEHVGAMLEHYVVGGDGVQSLANAITEAVNRSRLFIALRGAGDPNSKGEAKKASPTSETGSAVS